MIIIILRCYYYYYYYHYYYYLVVVDVFHILDFISEVLSLDTSYGWEPVCMPKIRNRKAYCKGFLPQNEV